MMKVVSAKSEVRELISSLRLQKKTIGFVPTMGFLHAGHLSLVEHAKKMTDYVIVSIFVNPTQFGEGEDFNNYPRAVEKDIKLLTDYSVDLVYQPETDTFYNITHKSWVYVEELSEKLCGKSRKGHFRGVNTVVAKLINIITPDLIFMGEKDYQQVLVLEKMIADLDFSTQIVRCKTVRESDGLAMSSRNSYLSMDERKRALCLYQSLLLAQNSFSEGINSAENIILKMRKLIERNDGQIDYISIVDPLTLEDIAELTPGCRILLAVHIGKTRLIDNIEITQNHL